MAFPGFESSLPPGLSLRTRRAEAQLRPALLAKVRTAMEELPDWGREVVALRSGAELSMEEMSEELSLSRPALLVRIGQTLDALRTVLLEKGQESAVPLLTLSGMRAALLDGEAAPAGFHERIIRRLEDLQASGRAADSAKEPSHA